MAKKAKESEERASERKSEKGLEDVKKKSQLANKSTETKTTSEKQVTVKPTNKQVTNARKDSNLKKGSKSKDEKERSKSKDEKERSKSKDEKKDSNSVKELPKKNIVKPIKEKARAFYFKTFNRWDTEEIQVTDPGLKSYISLRPVLVPFTAGRFTEKQFWKSKKPLVERLVNRVMVSGHKRKKHFRTSGTFSGKKHTAYKTVIRAFEIIEKRTKKNPIEVFVKAVENSSAREGITTIEYGGVGYPKAVDLSPQKRIDLVLRWLTQGAFHNAAKSKSKLSSSVALANQILLAYENDNKGEAISRKVDMERQAQASR